MYTYVIFTYLAIYLCNLFAGLGWPDYRLFGRPLIERLEDEKLEN